MADAKERILLIGWDFDPRIALTPDDKGKGEPLGDYLLALARDQPDRDIDILRWNFGGLKQFAVPRILSMVVRWRLTRAISFRLDSAHPVGCSHHQKVAVFDDHLAVCGGRSEEHTSELQSLMRISYAVFCLKKKITIATILDI